MTNFYIRKGTLWFSGTGKDGWTNKVEKAKKFSTFNAAGQKRMKLENYHEDLTVEMFSLQCLHCKRHFTDDVCNQRLECYKGSDETGYCTECEEYFEGNPNRGQNIHVRVKARIHGPYRHYKTKEVIGYHVSLYLGRNRSRVNTMVLLEDIDKLELLK